MPAQWINLLIRVNNVLDIADKNLCDADRDAFIARAAQAVLSRRHKRLWPLGLHPLPQGQPLHSRDPTGETADSS